MKKDVTVVLLAAGIGKRFWPFVTDKSLFPLFGEPIIVHNLRKLTDVGLTNVIVVTNPVNDEYIRSVSLPSLTIQTVVQKMPGGMGDALLTAAPHIQGKPIVVMNAEDIVESSLYQSISDGTHADEAFVVGKHMDEYFDGGYLQLSQNKLHRIVEKPGIGREPSQLINLVFHFFPNADPFIDLVRGMKTTHDDHYELALDRYAKEHSVSVISYEGYWSPLKYPWHVLDIHTYFMRKNFKPGKGRNVQIRNNVSIEGAVVIGSNVKIFENTKIVGPVYIGDNTIIGNNNIIRESFIGENCVTGFNTDITRSYIGDSSWFHSNYIGDSILEGDISMGSGSVLANLRLDEGEIWSFVKGTRLNTHKTKLGAMIGKHVRIGVNTSIMPGIKIGPNSFVGAGIVLDRDLSDGSFCAAKVSYEIKKNTGKLSGNRSTYKAKL